MFLFCVCCVLGLCFVVMCGGFVVCRDVFLCFHCIVLHVFVVATCHQFVFPRLFENKRDTRDNAHATHTTHATPHTQHTQHTQHLTHDIHSTQNNVHITCTPPPPPQHTLPHPRTRARTQHTQYTATHTRGCARHTPHTEREAISESGMWPSGTWGLQPRVSDYFCF